MIRGLYTGASGMLAEQFRVDAISNNLANVNTPGYKRDIVLFSSAPETMVYRAESAGTGIGERQIPAGTSIGSMGRGVLVDGLTLDLSPGEAQYTGNDLDLYVESGYFVVNTANGPLYTRAGSFRISDEGMLVDAGGNPIMGESGEIFVTGKAPVVVDEDGRIFDGDRYVDTLAVVDFEKPWTLRKTGSNLIAASPESGQFVPERIVVKQGYLEKSNVNSVTEMVDLIAATRSYEASQKVIQAQDEALGKAVNEVGKL